MAVVYEYLLAVFWNWWWLVTVILFVIDKTLEWAWSGYRDWLTRTFSLKRRRRIFWLILLTFVFVAGFLAWKDEHNKVIEKSTEISRLTHTAGSPAELEAIREVLTPRHLTEQQQEQIAGRLRAWAGSSYKVSYIDAAGEDGEERREYAVQFIETFRKAGWTGPAEPEAVGTLARGVFVYVKNSEKALSLEQLLKDAFAETDVHHVKVQRFNSDEDMQILVLVGSKAYLNE